MRNKIILSLSFMLLLSACASRPKLYPNAALKSKGKEASEADINLCMEEADTYLESSEGKKIAKSAGFGAVVGGAVGAVAGAFSGNIARGAAQGAAIGGAGGAVSGALTPDQLKHRYVNQCLADKGYRVLGWD
ncbi:MAG: glycine zipper domain-containing protein [Bacteriovorax sp.]